jgi:hypothetical protein
VDTNYEKEQHSEPAQLHIGADGEADAQAREIQQLRKHGADMANEADLGGFEAVFEEAQVESLRQRKGK